MIIATRVLKLKNEHDVLDIPVRIFLPKYIAAEVWSCRYEIEWPVGKWAMEAGGADSVQAIFLAMQMIGSEIYTSSYHKSGMLFLDAPGRGYGFPVPVSLRHLLEGEDAAFL